MRNDWLHLAAAIVGDTALAVLAIVLFAAILVPLVVRFDRRGRARMQSTRGRRSKPRVRLVLEPGHDDRQAAVARGRRFMADAWWRLSDVEAWEQWSSDQHRRRDANVVLHECVQRRLAQIRMPSYAELARLAQT